jgi:DNA polymerase-3 subunit epsilon
MQHVHGISFQPCGTELMACILESAEIKKKWPIFNSSQKKWEDIYGIFMFEDQNGYLRLAIDKNRRRLNPVHTFHYLVDGHAMIRKLVKDFDLCPKLCFMQTDPGKCEGIQEGYCKGACEQKESSATYNARVKKACAELGSLPSFAIIDKGISGDDQSCILVLEGKFYGMGYLPSDVQVTDPLSLKDHLTVYKENSIIRNLVYGFAARFPSKVLQFEIQIQ